MLVTIIGAGSWGSRVAQRLARIDGARICGVYDRDPERARATAAAIGAGREVLDLAAHMDVMRPNAVVIATPPAAHRPMVEAALAAGVRKIRVEKPLAPTVEDANAIIEACWAAGAELTVGFTLLHHPLYSTAFAFARQYGGAAFVRGTRVGRAPAHPIPARLDIGVHTTSIAAHLCCSEVAFQAVHADMDVRQTTIGTRDGALLAVDELALELETPDGTIYVDPDHDALGHDLSAWIDGTHRGTTAVALRAQTLAETPQQVAA